MSRRFKILALFVAVSAVALLNAEAAHALDAPRTDISIAQPNTAVFSNLAFRDTTSIIQSFAYDDVNKVWIFAQVQQSGRGGETYSKHVNDGDLTLTKVSVSGAILGYMHLNGFDHGLSIGVEPVGATTYVWVGSTAKYFGALGSSNAGGYATRIARFAWKNSATYSSTSSGITTYAPLGSVPEQNPYVDYKRNRIVVQYWSDAYKNFRWAIYPLDKFKAKDYTYLTRSSWPNELNSITNQGWAYVNDTMMLNYNGNGYSSSNVVPGHATLFKVGIPAGNASGNQGTVLEKVLVITAASLSPREPEGLTILGPDNVCVGFTSGSSTARRANVYCQKPVG